MGSAYERLLVEVKRLGCLREVLELLTWDLEVGMPIGAEQARADQNETISHLAHELLVSPHLRQLLEEAEREAGGRTLPPAGGVYRLPGPHLRRPLRYLRARDEYRPGR